MHLKILTAKKLNVCLHLLTCWFMLLLDLLELGNILGNKQILNQWHWLFTFLIERVLAAELQLSGLKMLGGGGSPSQLFHNTSKLWSVLEITKYNEKYIDRNKQTELSVLTTSFKTDKNHFLLVLTPYSFTSWKSTLHVPLYNQGLSVSKIHYQLIMS